MRMRKFVVPLLVAMLAFALVVVQGCGGQQQAAQTENKDIILATTTSTQDTGLLDELNPKFEEKTGYKVKTIAVGTGQALEMGKKGEADVLLVHAPKSEQEVVDMGAVINRQLVMHNDFIIVGPADDPAGIKGLKTAEAFKMIADKKAVFVSRGDESGTHKKEKEVWTAAGIKPEGDWYQQSGTGMAATLNIANDKQSYTLTDRGTYLAQKKNLSLDVLVEGDKVLLNIYHVMQVNPEKFDKVNKDGGKAYVDFMVSSEVQKIIEEFGKDKFGEPLFYPDAGKKVEELGK